MNAIQIPSKPTFGTPLGGFVFKSIVLFTLLIAGSVGSFAQDCTLSWNQHSNVGLSSAATFQCVTTIRPEDILTNPSSCPGEKTVALFSATDTGMDSPIDLSNMEGAQIDETYIGKTLHVVVTHDVTGQSAVATITIEDYSAPELMCEREARPSTSRVQFV